MSDHDASAGTIGSRRIVVGVDGSSPSLHAVEWAAREAAAHAASLEVVHVLYFPDEVLSEFAPEMERSAHEVLDEALAHARQVAPGTDVVGHLADPPTAHTLVQLARGAELLVIATREPSALRRLAMGSVGSSVIRHAPCPVVVVPPEQERSVASGPASRAIAGE